MSTEQFTRALQLTHSFDPAAVSSTARLEAERYLMDLRERPEGLNLSFHIISNEPVDEVRCFWAFNTIMRHLPALGAVGPVVGTLTAAVDDAQAEELYRTLFSFIFRYLLSPQQQQQQQQQGLGTSCVSSTSAGQGSTPLSDYLLNKHAQLMVVGLQCFYPNRWRSFFDDLFDLLDRSSAHPPTADAVAIYFLRVLEYIDERVVSVRDRTLQERGKELRARDMAVKDSMREHVIPRLVGVWFALLSEVRHRAPEIAFLCLSVAQTYIDWIDVSLVMTMEWINLLYFTMTVPPTNLRVAACECILSLVAKKQLPGVKMESLRALGVVSSLPHIVGMLTVPPRSEDDVALIDAVARLTVAVAEQFLPLVDMCTSGTRPQTSALIAPETGLSVSDIPFEITPELARSLTEAVHAVVAQLLRIYSIPNLPDIHEVLLPFLQVYIKSQVLEEHEAVQTLLSTFDHTRIDGLARGHDDKIWDDSTVDHRRLLFQVIRLLHRRHPELVMSHLYAVVQGVVEGRGPSPEAAAGGDGMSGAAAWAALSSREGEGAAPRTGASLAHMDFRHPEVVEAVLHYVYEMGEALRLETVLRDLADPVAVMVARLLTSDAVAVHQTNPCVHLVFFECLERYHLFFVFHSAYIPVLLERLLLLPCGVTNVHDRVRGRICYVLSRVVQLLKSSLRPYAVDMVHAIIVIVGKTVNSGGRTGLLLLPNDQRELYEATGTLLSLLLPRATVAVSSTSSTSPSPQPSASVAVSAADDISSLGSASSGLPRSLSAPQLQQQQQQQDSAPRGGGERTAESGEEAAYCVTLAQAVIEGVVRHLQAVSSSADGNGNGSPLPATGDGSGCGSGARVREGLYGRGSGVSGATALRGVGVADAISYLGALAKGLAIADLTASASGGSGSGSSGGGGGGAVGNPLTASFTSGAGPAGQEPRPALRIAELFAAVTGQHVMQVLHSPWRGSLAVRDAGCQFMQQMVNTVPFELIGTSVESYIALALTSMESVPELSRLLRLMYQFVNKSGSKGVAVASRMTPLAWSKLLTLGELSSARSPVVYLGVISESAREKADAYRQFFAYLFSTAAWGCAVAFLLMPEDCCLSILQQLVDAVLLPVDVELPRAAMQTLTKLVSELLGVTTTATAVSRAEQLLAAYPSASAQLRRGLAMVQHVVLTDALPTIIRAALRPAPPRAAAGEAAVAPPLSPAPAGEYFDLTDGKSFVLLGEIGALCKACSSTPFGEQALQVVYESLTAGGLISGEEAMKFCCAVRGEPRFSSTMRVDFRRMLERAQERRSAGQSR